MIRPAVSPLDAPARLTAMDRSAVVTALRARVGAWPSIAVLAELLEVRVRSIPGWPVEVATTMKDRIVAIADTGTAMERRQAIARGLASMVLHDSALAFVDRDVNPLADALIAGETHVVGAVA